MISSLSTVLSLKAKRICFFRQSRRSFARRIEDIPATLRHHVKGMVIDPTLLEHKVLSEGIVDITHWIKFLKELRIEHTRRMQTMHEGCALQGTMQAILMINGLFDRAAKLDESLGILQRYITSRVIYSKHSGHQFDGTTPAAELTAALANLKPYYDGKRFIFDFDPPFYLLSQN